MLEEVRPDIGFQAAESCTNTEIAGRLESIALAAVRKPFSPEFLNRLDAVITCRPLDDASLSEVPGHHVADLQRHVHPWVGQRSFESDLTRRDASCCSPEARARNSVRAS